MTPLIGKRRKTLPKKLNALEKDLSNLKNDLTLEQELIHAKFT